MDKIPPSLTVTAQSTSLVVSPFRILKQRMHRPEDVQAVQMQKVFFDCEVHLTVEKRKLEKSCSKWRANRQDLQAKDSALRRIARISRQCDLLQSAFQQFGAVCNVQKNAEACTLYKAQIRCYEESLHASPRPRQRCQGRSAQYLEVLALHQKAIALFPQAANEIIGMPVTLDVQSVLLQLLLSGEDPRWKEVFLLSTGQKEQQAYDALARLVLAAKKVDSQFQGDKLLTWAQSMVKAARVEVLLRTLKGVEDAYHLASLITLEKLLGIAILDKMSSFGDKGLMKRLLEDLPLALDVFKGYEGASFIPFDITEKMLQHFPEIFKGLLSYHKEFGVATLRWLLEKLLVPSGAGGDLVVFVMQHFSPWQREGHPLIRTLLKVASEVQLPGFFHVALTMMNFAVHQATWKKNQVSPSLERSLRDLIRWGRCPHQQLLAFMVERYLSCILPQRRHQRLWRISYAEGYHLFYLSSEQDPWMNTLTHQAWRKGTLHKVHGELLLKNFDRMWNKKVYVRAALHKMLSVFACEKVEKQEAFSTIWEEIEPEWRRHALRLVAAALEKGLSDKEVMVLFQFVARYPYQALVLFLVKELNKRPHDLVRDLDHLLYSIVFLNTEEVEKLFKGSTKTPRIEPPSISKEAGQDAWKSQKITALLQSHLGADDTETQEILISGIKHWERFSLLHHFEELFTKYWKRSPGHFLKILQFPQMGFVGEMKEILKADPTKKERLLNLMDEGSYHVVSSTFKLSSSHEVHKKVLALLDQNPKDGYAHRLAVLCAYGYERLVATLLEKNSNPDLSGLVDAGRWLSSLSAGSYPSSWKEWQVLVPLGWSSKETKKVTTVITSLLAQRPLSASESEQDQLARERRERQAFALTFANAMVTEQGHLVMPTYDTLVGLEGFKELLGDGEYVQHLARILRFMHQDLNLRDWGMLIADVGGMHVAARDMVAQLCGRSQPWEVQQRDLIVVVLSACLSWPRQSLLVGSCVAAREVIYAHSTPEGVLQQILDYITILNEGVFYGTSRRGRLAIPIPKTYFATGEQTLAEHPLLGAVEYAITTMSHAFDKDSLWMRNLETIFGEEGVFDAILEKVQGLCQMPSSLRKEIQDALQQTYCSSALEMFEPRLQIKGTKELGGWMLVHKDGKNAKEPLEGWRGLFPQIVDEAFGAMRYICIGEHVPVLDEVKKHVSVWFAPKDHGESLFETLVKFYWGKSYSNEALPWLSTPGARPQCVMKSLYVQKDVAILAGRSIHTAEESLQLFLEFCHDLPQATKEACIQGEAVCLPMDVAEHSMLAMPGDVLQAYRNGMSPATLLACMKAQAASRVKQLVSYSVVDEIIKRLHGELSEMEKSLLQSQGLGRLFGKASLQRICQTLLSQILLIRASLSSQATLQEAIDCIAWNLVLFPESTRGSLILADSNWYRYWGKAAYVTYIPSAVTGGLTLCTTHRDSSLAVPLGWNPCSETWVFYGPINRQHDRMQMVLSKP